MRERSFRNEILAASHRWPIIVLYCLIGALIGYGVARLLPTPYSATAELYVGLDIYRWAQDPNTAKFTGGASFNYPDDYKNWQMANLNVFVQTDEVLKETLDRLRNQDPYWLGINRNQLARMVHVYWRNVGKWRLVVENNDPKKAKQAVNVWRNVVIEKVQNALFRSRETLTQDIQLQAISADQTRTVSRLTRLDTGASQLQALKETVGQQPAAQPIPELLRWQIWSWAASLAGLDPLWNGILNSFPAETAPREDYQAWIARTESAIAQDRELTQADAAQLEKQFVATTQAYKSASDGSFGLSPNLTVDVVSENISPPVPIRPTGQMVLTGMLMGLFVWILLWLARITLRIIR